MIGGALWERLHYELKVNREERARRTGGKMSGEVSREAMFSQLHLS